MCSPSLPSISLINSLLPIALTREVLIEKCGHKTATEKKEWLQNHNIMLYHPNTGTAITGGGYSSVTIGCAVGSTASGAYSTPLDFVRFQTVLSGGDYSSTLTAISSYTVVVGRENTTPTTITPEEYDRLGKLGTKKWGFCNK